MRRAHPLGVGLLAAGSVLSVATTPPPEPVAVGRSAEIDGGLDLAAGEVAVVAFRIDVSCARPAAQASRFPQDLSLNDSVDVRALGAEGTVIGTLYVDGEEGRSAYTDADDGGRLFLGFGLQNPCEGAPSCGFDVEWELTSSVDTRIEWSAYAEARWPAESGGACLVFLSEV